MSREWQYLFILCFVVPTYYICIGLLIVKGLPNFRPLWRLLSRVGSSSHIAQAAAIGAATTALSLLLYWLLKTYWIVYDTTDPMEHLGIEFGFGQVFTAFFTIFLAAALGFFAIREFSEQHELPKLRVILTDSPHPSKQIVNYGPPGQSAEYYRASFGVENSGLAISNWFMITVELPFMLSVVVESRQKLETAFDFSLFLINNAPYSIGGNGGHWKHSYNSTTTFTSTFYSLGTIAAYPGADMLLLTFRVRREYILLDHVYECPYKIYSDRNKPVAGTLSVTFSSSQME